MELGLFLEFPVREGGTENGAFREAFELVDRAEDTGVGSVWLAEYHFNAGRVLASPVTIASAIAARTERLRIGLAVLLLPLANPVRVAEEIATLDHISNGRVEFGVGRGTFPNVHEGFGVPFTESRARFEEGLEVIRSAWTNQSFSFHGDYYTIDELEVTPKPFQAPHPPITVGVTSAESFAITGRMGYPLIVNPSRVFTLADLAEHIQDYRKAWKDAGHEGEGKVGLRVPIYVADTVEQAYEEPRESALFSMGRLSDRVASYAGHAGTTGDWAAQAEKVRNMTYDDWLADKVAYGTADMVTEKLKRITDELGLDQIMFEVNYGNLISQDQQIHSLNLMMEQVAPNLS